MYKYIFIKYLKTYEYGTLYQIDCNVIITFYCIGMENTYDTMLSEQIETACRALENLIKLVCKPSEKIISNLSISNFPIC